MTTLISNVVATRKLLRQYSDDKPVLVRIGKPRKISANEWECAFHITNIGMNEIQYGHGIDGLQALIQAIEGSRDFLRKSGYQLSWEGGEDGDTGIPRYVPTFYGPDFTEKLIKMIDSEVESFAEWAEKEHASHGEGIKDLETE